MGKVSLFVTVLVSWTTAMPGTATLFDADIIAAELDRLANLQQPDGGWTVDFESFSPAAALEWRGYATVAAVIVLTE